LERDVNFVLNIEEQECIMHRLMGNILGYVNLAGKNKKSWANLGVRNFVYWETKVIVVELRENIGNSVKNDLMQTDPKDIWNDNEMV